MTKKISLAAFLILVCLFACSGLRAQEKYVRLGDEAYNQYQYLTAIENYQKALTQLSGNADDRDRITLRLAEIYSRTDNWKMASSYYKRLIGNGFADKNPRCFYDYAIAQQYLGNDSLSLAYYQRYLDSVPSDSLALKRKKDLETLKTISGKVKYEVTNARVFNSQDDDFSLIYANKKENEIIFTTNRKGSTGKDVDQWTSSLFSDLFKSTGGKAEKFSVPVNADDKGIVNTGANEGAPYFDKDYSTLYFTRCERKPENKDGSMWCTIMRAQRSGAHWIKPEVVLSDPIRNIGHPALTSDELTLIFSGSADEGSGQKDLFMARRKSWREPFGSPVNLGPVINTAGDELFPYLRNDSLLYFASDGHGGYGGLDIWHSFLMPSGDWSAPVNLGAPINSNADDFSIVFRRCCEEGYFSSNRSDGRGGDDIYHFARISFRISLSGHVTDRNTGKPLPASSVFLISETDSLISDADAQGYYHFPDSLIAENHDYQVLASHPDYLSGKQVLNTGRSDEDRDLVIDFSLEAIPAAPIVLPQILYELDKWDLQPQYQDSLKNFIVLLKDNPNLQIELRSHTDSRATDKYNDELSQKRAQTVVDYLISNGIEPARLVAKGYGKRYPRKLERDFRVGDFFIPEGTVLDEPYVDSLGKPEWQEEAHQLNRRTEFSVISSNYKP